MKSKALNIVLAGIVAATLSVVTTTSAHADYPRAHAGHVHHNHGGHISISPYGVSFGNSRVGVNFGGGYSSNRFRYQPNYWGTRPQYNQIIGLTTVPRTWLRAFRTFPISAIRSSCHGTATALTGSFTSTRATIRTTTRATVRSTTTLRPTAPVLSGMSFFASSRKLVTNFGSSARSNGATMWNSSSSNAVSRSFSLGSKGLSASRMNSSASFRTFRTCFASSARVSGQSKKCSPYLCVFFPFPGVIGRPSKQKVSL